MNKDIKNWEELSRETVFEKYGRKIDKVRFRLPDGQEGNFYIKNEVSPVCVLALTKNNEVILAKQFRPGLKETLYELPGGGMDSNETSEEAMERELLEETGYKGKMKLVTKVYDCGYSTINRYCFVATECEKVEEQNLEEREFIEVVLMPLNKFRDLLRSGKMTDVEIGYLGLDYLNLL